ncbi:bifunctional nicotinamidase/pyrazinamidase [Geomonas agri]|uniref:bifunctional nicotinamidase/pyrazinamidase n=1 Tax=Geomonas agri TaxID=2873702 RepID=UPI001CD6E07C|nr:bifunctional nicotinamidase/pyrazinamidase [Geomonas agri]
MQRRAALLVVDVQIDFCPGGALAVPNGDQVVPLLNRYLELFNQRSAPVFASRDWHPEQSKHFKEQGGIWPVHCVQGTAGADFHPGLRLPEGTILISKGMTNWDNGYSALQGVTENGTPLAMLLRRMELDRLYVGGLATDYCVKESVLDALKEGFTVTVLTDAIRGVEVQAGDSEHALQEMLAAGAGQATFASVRSTLQAEGEAHLPARTG